MGRFLRMEQKQLESFHLIEISTQMKICLPAEVTNRPHPTVSDETQQIEKTIFRSVNLPVTNPFPEQAENLN